MDFSSTAGRVLFLACAGLVIFNCRRDIRELVSAKNAFLLTIMAWFLLEAALAPEELRIFSQEIYHYGLLCVIICIVAFLTGYQSTKGGFFDPFFRKLAKIDNSRVMWWVFISACAVGFIPLIYYSQGNLLLILDDAFIPKARWSSIFQRGRYGGFRDAFLELQIFLRAAVPLAAVVLMHRKQTSDKKLVAGAFLLYMFARAVTGGTRSQVVEVFLPLAAAIYWGLTPRLKRYALWIGLPAFVMAGMLYSAANVIGRNAGTIEWEKASEVNYVGFEMFRELLFIANAVPEHQNYKLGRTYFVQAINPIPRAIWPGKPIDDAGLELAKVRGAVAGGDAYLTVSPGMIGEMYWNFGIPGIVIISYFFGYLAKSWDKVRPYASQSLLAFTVFAAGLAIIFLSGRSINMATLYGLLALFVLLVTFST